MSRLDQLLEGIKEVNTEMNEAEKRIARHSGLLTGLLSLPVGVDILELAQPGLFTNPVFHDNVTTNYDYNGFNETHELNPSNVSSRSGPVIDPAYPFMLQLPIDLLAGENIKYHIKKIKANKAQNKSNKAQYLCIGGHLIVIGAGKAIPFASLTDVIETYPSIVGTGSINGTDTTIYNPVFGEKHIHSIKQWGLWAQLGLIGLEGLISLYHRHKRKEKSGLEIMQEKLDNLYDAAIAEFRSRFDPATGAYTIREPDSTATAGSPERLGHIVPYNGATNDSIEIRKQVGKLMVSMYPVLEQANTFDETYNLKNILTNPSIKTALKSGFDSAGCLTNGDNFFKTYIRLLFDENPTNTSDPITITVPKSFREDIKKLGLTYEQVLMGVNEYLS